MATSTVVVEPNDEIGAVLSKLRDSQASDIRLIMPAQPRVLQDLDEFNQLRAAVKESGKNVTIVSSDKTTRGLAKILGFSVAAAEGGDTPSGPPTSSTPPPSSSMDLGNTMSFNTNSPGMNNTTRFPVPPEIANLSYQSEPAPPSRGIGDYSLGSNTSYAPSNSDYDMSLDDLNNLDTGMYDTDFSTNSGDQLPFSDDTGVEPLPVPRRREAKGGGSFFSNLFSRNKNGTARAGVTPTGRLNVLGDDDNLTTSSSMPLDLDAETQPPPRDTGSSHPSSGLMGSDLGRRLTGLGTTIRDAAVPVKATADTGMRMPKPETTPEEAARRRNQSRMLLIGGVAGAFLIFVLFFGALYASGAFKSTSPGTPGPGTMTVGPNNQIVNLKIVPVTALQVPIQFTVNQNQPVGFSGGFALAAPVFDDATATPAPILTPTVQSGSACDASAPLTVNPTPAVQQIVLPESVDHGAFDVNTYTGSKATAKVTIRNGSETAQFIGAGTPVGTINGITFYTNAGVTVAASDLSIPRVGSAVVSVTAGTKGSGANDKYFGKTNLKSTLVVAGGGPVTGGSDDRQVAAPSQADHDEALTMLIAQARNDAAGKFQTGDAIVLNETFKVVSAGEKMTPGVKQDAPDKKFTLSANMTVSVMTITKANFLTAITSQISSNPCLSGIAASTAGVTVGDLKIKKIDAAAGIYTYETVASIPVQAGSGLEQQIKSNIANKSIAEARQYLDSLKQRSILQSYDDNVFTNLTGNLPAPDAITVQSVSPGSPQATPPAGDTQQPTPTAGDAQPTPTMSMDMGSGTPTVMPQSNP